MFHVPRQANKAADIVAKMALGSRPELHLFMTPVPELLHQLVCDVHGSHNFNAPN